MNIKKNGLTSFLSGRFLDNRIPGCKSKYFNHKHFLEYEVSIMRLMIDLMYIYIVGFFVYCLSPILVSIATAGLALKLFGFAELGNYLIVDVVIYFYLSLFFENNQGVGFFAFLVSMFTIILHVVSIVVVIFWLIPEAYKGLKIRKALKERISERVFRKIKINVL